MAETSDNESATSNNSNANLLLDQATLQALVNAITGAFNTAASNASTSTATSTTYSTSIDPYDDNSLDVNQKDGRYQWVFLTKMQEGWKVCSVSVDTAEVLMDLFNSSRIGKHSLVWTPS